MPAINSPLADKMLLSLTPDQIADMYARQYDYRTDNTISRPSKEERDALAQAYASINGAAPVQSNAGMARPVMTQQAPTQQSMAPPMAYSPDEPYVPVSGDQTEYTPAVSTSPARQAAEMPMRGEDPRIRIPGLRSQEVPKDLMFNPEDDYVVGYTPYGQAVKRGIAPHASDYQEPATNKWSGAQRFDQQADKRQLIAMQIMIDGGIAPERAERAALGMLSLDQREMDMLRANQKSQRNRQISQETERRQARMEGY